MGEVKQAGTAVPDSKDPAYDRYLKKMREQETEAPKLYGSADDWCNRVACIPCFCCCHVTVVLLSLSIGASRCNALISSVGGVGMIIIAGRPQS